MLNARHRDCEVRHDHNGRNTKQGRRRPRGGQARLEGVLRRIQGGPEDLLLDGATAVAIAGAMSDAEYLVNLAKAERRLLALRRGYPLSVKESAKLISNIVYSC